jgi:hypothetical protein
VSAYVDQAIVVADHEAEMRIVIEPGYTDDRDRDCLRFMVTIKNSTGELRLPVPDAKTLAKRLIEQALGHAVKLTIRRDGAR